MRHTLRSTILLSLLLGTAAMAASPASAETRFRTRAVGEQGAAFVAGGTNAQGDAHYLRGRAVTRNSSGDITLRSGGVYQGANGGVAARAGKTTRNADGSLTHQSGFAAQSAQGGTVQSQGSLTRTADGAEQSRSTTATAANGNTYTGSTTYSSQTGPTHTGACTDAAGNTISCR